MSCKFFLKMKGWTDIKALENTESIKNEGLYLCASTLRRQVAFFFSSPAPFWHFGDAPVSRSRRGGVGIDI